MSKTKEFLSGLKVFFTEDKFVNQFSFDKAWYDYEDKKRDDKVSAEAHEFIYYARNELDGPFITQPLLQSIITPIKYRAYGLYNYRIAEDFGYIGVIKLIDRSIELMEVTTAFDPIFKQKLKEAKNKKQTNFTIQYTTLDKYSVNDYGCLLIIKDWAQAKAFKLSKNDDGWFFDQEKD